MEEINYYKKEGKSPNVILDQYVLGRSFITTYGNQRIYRVEKVTKMTPESPFPDLARAKTFSEYFKNQYKITIKDKKQFLVAAYGRRANNDS